MDEDIKSDELDPFLIYNLVNFCTFVNHYGKKEINEMDLLDIYKVDEMDKDVKNFSHEEDRNFFHIKIHMDIELKDLLRFLEFLKVYKELIMVFVFVTKFKLKLITNTSNSFQQISFN